MKKKESTMSIKQKRDRKYMQYILKFIKYALINCFSCLLHLINDHVVLQCFEFILLQYFVVVVTHFHQYYDTLNDK